MAEFVEKLLIRGGTWNDILEESKAESERRRLKWGQSMSQLRGSVRWLSERGYTVESDEERVKITWPPPDGEKIHDAVETTLRLEQDLQDALRQNIVRLEAGLKIIDGGSEHSCEAGYIDILCEDGQGALVIVELKAGEAKDAALGQVLGYMGAIKH
jgi:RecB family endonuclease NucS